MDNLANTLMEFVNTPWAPFLLMFHSYLESFFLPGAHDIVLLAVTIIKPSSAFFFALFSAVGSTLGGASAYLFARYLGRPLIEKIMHKHIADSVEKSYQKFGMWAVAFAGFTPVPYKLFSLCSGFFEINFPLFVIISFLARTARFMLLALLVRLFGDQIQEHIISYFNFFSIIMLSAAALCYCIYKFKKHRKAQTQLEE